MTITISSPYITQSKIKPMQNNNNVGERKLWHPLPNKSEFDTDSDDDMIVGFNHLLPFHADTHHNYLKTFTGGSRLLQQLLAQVASLPRER
jgi:hypothetical protein